MSEFIASLVVLAILGVFVSGYLIKKRVKKETLVCPMDGGCEKVVQSKWNHILVIKNDVAGLFYYILILFLVFYLFFVSEELLFFSKLISGIALFFSVFLAFIQAKVIREYCFYCLISALITLLIFVNVMIL